MLSDFSFARDTIGFIMEGDVDTAAMRELGNRIYETLEENKKMSMYLEDMNVRRFSFSSISSAILFPFRCGSKFYKMALISDRWWIHALGSLQNLICGVKIRTFTSEHRVNAMSWIMDR